MNLVVLKTNLKEGLNIISGAKKDNVNLPVLKNFLIETDGGKLKLVTTDLEIAVSSYISAKIINDGSFSVPYAIFNQIVNNLSSERINLEFKGNSLLLTTDSYKAKIATSSKEEFPLIPKIKEKESNSIKINSQILSDALIAVSSACQMSDLRPELNGVFFLLKDGYLKLVATDSFRLAEKNINEKDFKSKTNKDVSFIIPLKTIQEVIRIFSSDEEISIFFDQNQVAFESEKTQIISRLIDGKFPDYEVIIPKSFDTEVRINKNDLISALKLTSSLSNKLNEVKVLTDDSLKNIKVFSSNQEFGESEYLLPSKIKGEKIQINFNWRFILDALRNIKTEEVFIGFNGEDKPSLIKSQEDQSFLYILMPIKSS